MGISLSKIKGVPIGTTETKHFYIIDDVKVFKFPKKPLLTQLEEYILRGNLQNFFSSVFSKFLRKNINKEDDDLLNLCTESLSIPLYIFYDPVTKKIKDYDETDKKTLRQYPLTNPIFTNESFIKLFSEKLKLNEPESASIKKDVSTWFISNNLYLLKDEFDKCDHLQYFIPLSTFNIISKTGHQNLLVINKNDKIVTWIEPQFDVKHDGKDRITLITNTINKLLDFLIKDTNLRREYQIDFPTKTCPQAITLDTNCMFWSFLLAMHLVINNNSKIDEVSQAILKKFPDKNSLSAYMNNFKAYLKEFKLFGGSKNRKTIRRKLKNRKHTRKSIAM